MSSDGGVLLLRQADRRLGLTFDFGPNGLRFSPSAKMNADASIFGPGKVQVRPSWFDPAQGLRALEQVVTVERSYVTFDIRHLSKYRIS